MNTFRSLSTIILSASFLFCSGLLHANTLMVGAAKVDISAQAYEDGNPPERTYPHEWLYIRAIVIDNGDTKAVLIGADMSGMRPDSVYQDASAAITSEMGIPAENIIMSGTHTHSAIRNLRDPSKIVPAIVQAVREANADLKPASMGYGEGLAYLNTNRDMIDKETRRWTQEPNPDYPSDKTLAVLAFYGEDGRPIAGYMNYAAHPVSGYLAPFKSADFAGAASRHVELAFGDDMIMVFTQGASGDQNIYYLRASTNVMADSAGLEVTGLEMPRETAESPIREGLVKQGEVDPVLIDELKQVIQAQGQVLGEETIRVMSGMNRLVQDVKIEGRQTVLTCPGRTHTNPEAFRGEAGTYTDGPDRDLLLGMLNLNEIALGSVNAEVYNIIAQKFKAASPLNKTMLVTVANGRAGWGYIPNDAAYSHYTFQPVETRLAPGCAETGIVHNLNNMIYDYLRNN